MEKLHVVLNPADWKLNKLYQNDQPYLVYLKSQSYLKRSIKSFQVLVEHLLILQDLGHEELEIVCNTKWNKNKNIEISLG